MSSPTAQTTSSCTSSSSAPPEWAERGDGINNTTTTTTTSLREVFVDDDPSGDVESASIQSFSTLSSSPFLEREGCVHDNNCSNIPSTGRPPLLPRKREATPAKGEDGQTTPVSQPPQHWNWKQWSIVLVLVMLCVIAASVLLTIVVTNVRNNESPTLLINHEESPRSRHQPRGEGGGRTPPPPNMNAGEHETATERVRGADLFGGGP